MYNNIDPVDGETVLSLEDCRTHLNLTAADDFHDDAVEAARLDAISWTEYYTGTSMQERGFLWVTEQFCSVMPLPIGPVSAVTEISYFDADDVDTAIDSADWYVGANKLTAVDSWPLANGSPGGVRITFTAGYASVDLMPPHMMRAMKLAMTAFFEDRSNPDLSGAMRVADHFRIIL